MSGAPPPRIARLGRPRRSPGSVVGFFIVLALGCGSAGEWAIDPGRAIREDGWASMDVDPPREGRG
jgi:hypothetical protein